MISRGNSIAFDAQLAKFVHLSCSAIKNLVARQTAVTASHSDTADVTPAGLKPGSIVAYVKEWSRYLAYAIRNGFLAVPGLDEPWCYTPSHCSGAVAGGYFAAQEGPQLYYNYEKCDGTDSYTGTV